MLKGMLQGLLAAVQIAIDRADEQLNAHQAARLAAYFDQEGKPLYLPLELPYLDPNSGEIRYRTVNIPRLCVAPPSFLRLDALELDIPLAVEDFSDVEGDDSVQIEITPGTKDSSARMHLTFKGGETPQALQKVSDMMTRILP